MLGEGKLLIPQPGKGQGGAALRMVLLSVKPRRVGNKSKHDREDSRCRVAGAQRLQNFPLALFGGPAYPIAESTQTRIGAMLLSDL